MLDGMAGWLVAAFFIIIWIVSKFGNYLFNLPNHKEPSSEEKVDAIVKEAEFRVGQDSFAERVAKFGKRYRRGNTDPNDNSKK